MIVHLAAYDPALATPDGDYWVWKSTAVPVAVRDRFYGEIYRTHAPSDPNRLGSEELHGGCLTQGEWACFYRFYDGGRDLRGRPGRFVLLCLFTARSAVVNRDCAHWLRRGPLHVDGTELTLGKTPRPPADLDQDLEAPRFSKLESQPRSQTFEGPTAEADAWVYGAALPESCDFHWKVASTSGVARAEIECFPRKRVRPSVELPHPKESSNKQGRFLRGGALPNNSARDPQSRKSYLSLLIGLVTGTALGWGTTFFGFGDRPTSDAVDLEGLDAYLRQFQVPTSGVISLTQQEAAELVRRIQTNEWSVAAPQSFEPSPAPGSLPPSTLDSQPERAASGRSTESP